MMMLCCCKRDFLKLLAVPLGMSAGLIPVGALAQRKLSVAVKKACSYDGRGMKDDVYAFEANRDAVTFVNAICGKVGLPANFVTLAANVPNAAAVIDGDQRYVLYSEIFMAEIAKAARTDWAGLSILAHEVGHHLSGHTLKEGGSRPPTELEADKFSGFVVARMGGSLDEATAVMRQISEEGSDTHPPRSARLEAIAAGWRSAMAERPAASSPPPATPTSSRPAAQPQPANGEGGLGLFR